MITKFWKKRQKKAAMTNETIYADDQQSLEKLMAEYEETYHWSLYATHVVETGVNSYGRLYAIYERFTDPTGAV